MSVKVLLTLGLDVRMQCLLKQTISMKCYHLNFYLSRSDKIVHL